MSYKKVKDYPDLLKSDFGFIVNNNHERYEQALQRTKTAKRIDSIEDRISSIEDSVQQILFLLKGKANGNTSDF